MDTNMQIYIYIYTKYYIYVYIYIYIYIYQHIPGRSTVAVGNYQQWWVWAATNQLQSGESPPLLLQSPMMHLKTWCSGDPLKTFSIFRPFRKSDCQCCVIELSQTTTSNMGEPWNIEKKKKHLLNNSEEHDHMGVEVMDPSRHHGSFNWSIGGDLPRGRAVNMHFRTLVRLWNVHNLGAPGNLDIYEIWSFWYHRDVPNLCIFMWYLMMFEISIYDIYHIYVRWVRYFKLWSKARCRNTLVHTRRQPHSSLRCWKQPKWVGQPRNYENHGEYHIAWRCQK